MFASKIKSITLHLHLHVSRDDKVKSTTKECGEAAGEGAGGGKDVHGYGGEGKGEDRGASGGLCEGGPSEYGPHRRQLHHHDPGAAGEDAEDPAAVLGGK